MSLVSSSRSLQCLSVYKVPWFCLSVSRAEPGGQAPDSPLMVSPWEPEQLFRGLGAAPVPTPSTAPPRGLALPGLVGRHTEGPFGSLERETDAGFITGADADEERGATLGAKCRGRVPGTVEGRMKQHLCLWVFRFNFCSLRLVGGKTTHMHKKRQARVQE